MISEKEREYVALRGKLVHFLVLPAFIACFAAAAGFMVIMWPAQKSRQEMRELNERAAALSGSDTATREEALSFLSEYAKLRGEESEQFYRRAFFTLWAQLLVVFIFPIVIAKWWLPRFLRSWDSHWNARAESGVLPATEPAPPAAAATPDADVSQASDVEAWDDFRTLMGLFRRGLLRVFMLVLVVCLGFAAVFVWRGMTQQAEVRQDLEEVETLLDDEGADRAALQAGVMEFGARQWSRANAVMGLSLLSFILQFAVLAILGQFIARMPYKNEAVRGKTAAPAEVIPLPADDGGKDQA